MMNSWRSLQKIPSRRRAFSSRTPLRSGQLSHVDAQNRPCMVDVSHKSVTIRSATARARVQLPPAVFALVEPQGGDTPAEIRGKKGPVFAAAIIAGTMAVKKTPELIPFCHPLPVEHVHVDISVDDEHDHSVRVSCTVRTTGKTGVEMEALTGASLAALCIYDMLKALSHDIVIADLRLDAKSGGKSDFTREFVGGNPDK